MQSAFSFCTLVFAITAVAHAAAPAELKGHTALVYSLAFSPNGKLLASGSFDNTIKLWSYPGFKEVKTLTGHANPVYCVAFSPDGNTLASSSQDQTIRFWNVADAKLIRELRGHTGIVEHIAGCDWCTQQYLPAEEAAAAPLAAAVTRGA